MNVFCHVTSRGDCCSKSFNNKHPPSRNDNFGKLEDVNIYCISIYICIIMSMSVYTDIHSI